MFDLAVIGGGPAGAAAAWSGVRRGWRVALLERGGFPRDKVCGEFVSAEAVPLLAAMAPALAEAAPLITAAAFISPRGRRVAFPLAAPALGVSRLALDAALFEAAGTAGAELRSHTAVTAVASDGEGEGWHLALATGAEIEARRVVVAAGRWWRIAGLASAAASSSTPSTTPAGSSWLGVKARFLGLRSLPSVEIYGFRGGYCGFAPVENGWTNACCLIRRERAGELGGSRDFAAWAAEASGSAPLAERLRGGTQATPTVVTAPVELGPRAAVANAVLLAGDASGFIDPFIGDGLARALLSGRLAAECGDDPRRYAEALRRAAQPAYMASAGLRVVLGAPAWAQAAALWGLARRGVGPRLVAATRWRTL